MEELGLTRLFGSRYLDRRVLVTGHTGFKGSWLVLWLRAMGARVAGLALDPDTEPSHWTLLGLADVPDHRVDLRDRTGVRRVVDEVKPEMVFHLAAQPLVRRGYREPVATFETNVMGLVNLFEAVRSCASVRVVVNATTDKVYAESATRHAFLESDALAGRDPYSASKACAEIISGCYRESYFGKVEDPGVDVRLATARAGNVVGGGDWAEDRLVPDLVRAATSNLPLRIRNPAATRPWQHVLEPLSGYLLLASAMLDHTCFSEAWNFGPDESGDLSVGELARRLGAGWPSLRIAIDDAHHPHEAPALRLNSAHAMRELSWKPVWSVDTALARTAAWYRQYGEAGRVSSIEDLGQYVRDARSAGLAWAE